MEPHWPQRAVLSERSNSHMATELSGVVADHIAAVNALDTDAVVATFARMPTSTTPP